MASIAQQAMHFRKRKCILHEFPCKCRIRRSGSDSITLHDTMDVFSVRNTDFNQNQHFWSLSQDAAPKSCLTEKYFIYSVSNGENVHYSPENHVSS
jgi:hypothetical protein